MKSPKHIDQNTTYANYVWNHYKTAWLQQCKNWKVSFWFCKKGENDKTERGHKYTNEKWVN